MVDLDNRENCESKAGDLYMCMRNPFQSVYDKAFDGDIYVYHYTNYDAACKILLGNSLKLSNPNKANDMREKKAKLRITDKSADDSDECDKVVSHILQHVRFLSVSKDQKVNTPSPYSKDDDRFFTDKTFRGFAYDGMWAYYGDNNKGVSFIFNKKKLKSLIEKSVRLKLVRAGSVSYKDRAQPYTMSYECIKDYCDGTEDINGIGALAALTFFKHNVKYLISKFFTKTKAWRDECEFRFVVVTDSQDPCFVNGIAECIEGIVVGEDMEKEKIRTLKLCVEDMVKKNVIKEEIPIRKISFDDDGTYLLDV